jgi:hypothetical protein
VVTPAKKTTRRPVRKAASLTGSRVKKAQPTTQEPRANSQNDAPGTTSEQGNIDRRATRQVEQLGILSLAIVLGVFGLALHGLWVATLIVLALLWGYMAASLRGRRGTGGVISNVLTTVVDEVHHIQEDVGQQPEDAEVRSVSP